MQSIHAQKIENFQEYKPLQKNRSLENFLLGCAKIHILSHNLVKLTTPLHLEWGVYPRNHILGPQKKKFQPAWPCDGQLGMLVVYKWST